MTKTEIAGLLVALAIGFAIGVTISFACSALRGL